MRPIGSILAVLTLLSCTAMAEPAAVTQTAPAPLEQMVDQTVKVLTGTGLGSGFFVAPIEGKTMILTAAHVVGNSTKVSIEYFDGSKSTANVVKVFPEIDLAIVMPERVPYGLLPAKLDCNKLKLGDKVVTIGYPMDIGLVAFPGVVVSSDTTNSPGMDYMYMVSALVNHGNSGGPVFNEKGLVVGMVLGMINGVDNVFGPGLIRPATDFCP